MLATHALHHAAVEFRKIARAETGRHERFRRHLVAIISATIIIDLVFAVLAYILEHDAPKTQITSLGSALFWTTTQLLTVSSSLQNPITTGGQILDVFMQIWAILIVTSLAGAFGSFLVSKAKSS